MTLVTALQAPTPERDLRGYLLVFFAGVLWSTVGLGIRLIDDALVWQILLYRSLSMSALLYVVIRLRTGRDPLALARASGWGGVIGGLSLVAAYTGGIYAVQSTSVANAMMLFASAPLLAAVLGRVILREMVRPQTWVAIAVASGGIAIMVWDKSSGAARQSGGAWLGAWLRGVHHHASLGQEYRDDALGVHLWAVRDCDHGGHLSLARAAFGGLPARYRHRAWNGGVSGRGWSYPLYHRIKDGARRRAHPLVAGRGGAGPGLGLAGAWGNREHQHADRRRGLANGDCWKRPVRRASQTASCDCLATKPLLARQARRGRTSAPKTRLWMWQMSDASGGDI